jgi:hypothetical protein
LGFLNFKKQKMKIQDLIIGVFIGLLSATIGSYLFITLVMKNDFFQGLIYMKSQGYLGKIITLGAALNIIAFFVLLKYNKEIMARGVILATLILTVITLFV